MEPHTLLRSRTKCSMAELSNSAMSCATYLHPGLWVVMVNKLSFIIGLEECAPYSSLEDTRHKMERHIPVEARHRRHN